MRTQSSSRSEGLPTRQTMLVSSRGRYGARNPDGGPWVPAAPARAQWLLEVTIHHLDAGARRAEEGGHIPYDRPALGCWQGGLQVQVDGRQHRPLGWLHLDAEGALLRMHAHLRDIQQSGVQQGDPPPPPGKMGHVHAVRQACEPRGDKLRTGLLQASGVGRRVDKVHDEAWDLPAVWPQAPAVGTDDAEADDARGAAP